MQSRSPLSWRKNSSWPPCVSNPLCTASLSRVATLCEPSTLSAPSPPAPSESGHCLFCSSRCPQVKSPWLSQQTQWSFLSPPPSWQEQKCVKQALKTQATQRIRRELKRTGSGEWVRSRPRGPFSFSLPWSVHHQLPLCMNRGSLHLRPWPFFNH